MKRGHAVRRCALLFLGLSALVAVAWAADDEEEAHQYYPKCWLKTGECLDQNVGPLMKGVRPQNNTNVVEVRNATFSLDDCVTHCMNNDKCG